jgi:hypothetical protein
MTFVIPAFETMFAEFGAKDALPKLTKIVIAISRGFVSYLPVTHHGGHRARSAPSSPSIVAPPASAWCTPSS